MLVWSATLAAAAPASPTWESTLERVAPSVVSLRVTSARDFDTEEAGIVVGTGFVVDARRGLLLTNRHLVQPGPVTAEATFLDDEVVTLTAVYRDPVHDFGFFQFDPSQIRHLTLTALELAPDAARVGTEIRLIGSDGGEKASILGGTLARLDRAAPNYGRGSYNDFNTFYLQAATNTSGGSSGAPVIDIAGRVLALNAGGSLQAASSYYLPLHRVARALEHLQRGEEVPRGGMQVTFLHAAYSDLRRGGVDADTEAALRTGRPSAQGLLVVQDVLPGGAADGLLLPGDALISIDGREIDGFIALDEILDTHVGERLAVRLLRRGAPVEAMVAVVDLHAITPDAFLELGGGVLHDLSYQQATAHGVRQEGVFVADPGYALAAGGVVDRAVIVQVGDVPTPRLSDLEGALATAGDGKRLRVRFSLVGDPAHVYERVVVIDRTWFPARRCERDPASGRWPCTAVVAPPAEAEDAPPGELPPMDGGSKWVREAAPSLVMVEQRVPYPTAGLSGRTFGGAGVVIDRDRGMVLTSREAVPVALGDVTLTFAGTVRVPGRVVALHPVHNLAVVAYDPSALGAVKVAEARWGARSSRSVGPRHLVGLDTTGRLLDAEVRLTGTDWLILPLDRPPRFRDYNVVVGQIAGAPDVVGGLIVDRAGVVHALWSSFGWEGRARRMAALPLTYVLPLVEQVRAGACCTVMALGAELSPLALADARERGLTDETLAAMLRHDRRAVAHEVVRVAGQTPAAGVLREGDLLVGIGGVPLTHVDQVERALGLGRPLQIEVLRDGALVQVEVPLAQWDVAGVRRVVTWAGAVVHEPHLEVFSQRLLEAPGVYVAWRWDGSPAAAAGLRPGERIVEVDGVPITGLQGFIEAIARVRAGDHTVVRVEDLDGRPIVRALFVEPDQWPGHLLDGSSGQWTRTPLPP